MASLIPGDEPRIVVRMDEQGLEFTRTDESIFRAVAEENLPLAQELVKSDRLTPEVGLSTAYDAWLALYRNVNRETEYGDPLQRIALNAMRAADNYEELREYTVGDELPAWLQGCATIGKVVENLPEDVVNAAKEARDAKEDADAAQGYADLLGSNPKTKPADLENAEQAAEAASKKLAKAQQKLAATTQQAGAQAAIAKAANRAVDEQVEECESHDQFMSSIGIGSGAGSPGNEAAETTMLLANASKSHPQFAKFCDLFGRLCRDILTHQLTKSTHDAGSVVDVTEGNDIGLVDEAELSELLDPDLAPFAEFRFVSEMMQQLEVEDTADAGRGDLFILVDVSGSMDDSVNVKGVGNVSRATQAKALCLAIARGMGNARRHATIGLFDDNDEAFAYGPVRIGPSDTRNSVAGAEKFLGVAGFKSGGGTSFDYPVSFCTKRITKDDRGKPDILIITDGAGRMESSTVNEVKRLKRVKGLRFYSIFVGGGAEAVHQIVDLSDRVWSADQLFAGVATEVIEQMV